MIEALWQRHYQPGSTGSYLGDMAQAFDRMRRDPECDRETAYKIAKAAREHCHMERLPSHEGRKYWCELFGHPSESMMAQ